MRNIPPTLATVTLNTLKYVLQNLEGKEKITEEIAILKRLAQKWEYAINNQASSKSPRTRSRREENARIVRHWFNNHPKGAATVREISNQTGIPYSSVQSLLQRGNEWEKDKNHRWRISTE